MWFDMSYTPKIYLGIITQNNEDDVAEICKTTHYLDGIFGVVHQPNTDRTFEILDQNKGGGEIIKLPYLQRNDWSMNGFLFNPKFMRGSWCLMADSLERFAENFLVQIKTLALDLEKNNIHYVYHYSKLMMFKKKDFHYFICHPHWTLANRENNAIRLEDYIPNDRDCRYSVRNEKRPKQAIFRHMMVYFLNSGYSNHMLLGRESKPQEYQVHEEVRQKFIDFCLNVLKIELTPEALKQYILENGISNELRFYILFEEVLNSWYCYYILGHKFEDVMARREKGELFNV